MVSGLSIFSEAGNLSVIPEKKLVAQPAAF
jgi:hypothetical protein